MEQLEQPDIVGLFAEVLFEEEIDCCLEHESIVDGNIANTFHAVPAWLAASRDALVHHVVCYQEICL